MLLDDLRLYELMVTAGHDAMAAGLLSALRQGQIVDVLAHEESRPVLAHLPRGPTSGPEPYDLDGAGDEDLSRVRGLVLADKKTASILEPLETKVPKAASTPRETFTYTCQTCNFLARTPVQADGGRFRVSSASAGRKRCGTGRRAAWRCLEKARCESDDPRIMA